MSGSFASLAYKLFGLKAGASDGARALAASIGETMLQDLIDQYRKTAERLGPGLLTVRIHNGKDTTRWATVEEVQRNLAIAEEYDDLTMVDLSRRILQRLDGLDPERKALLMICSADDATASARLYELDAGSDPERLRQHLEAFEA